jgi:flagellar biogenesis protein FliO
MTMDVIQPTFAVLFVLGLLGGTLYWLRNKGVARFAVNGIGRTRGKQIQSIERFTLTPQHSLHLVSVAGRTLLIAVSPAGCTVLEDDIPASPEVSR